MNTFYELLYDIFYQFIDPKKRIFIFYLIFSVIIALFWLIYNKKLSLKKSLKKIFNKKIFFSKSSKSDYKVFFINQTIMFLISPLLITQLTIATFLFYYFHSLNWIRAGIFENASTISVIFLFTTINFFLDDFSKFFVHRCMHKWKILWALHKVHHSATTLTPMTVFRTHPLEGIIFSLRSAVIQAITISSFVFLFGNNVDLLTVLGANIFVFLFNVFGSNLRHSHIGIRYWKWLEYILISPAQHQIHHSISLHHHDKNFGSAFAVWDWIFGSLHHSEETDNLTLGLDGHYNDKTHALNNLYFKPIKEISNIINNKFYKLKKYIAKKNILRRI
tara:strand:+ start:1901 stop:2899 length:999 start_codon:yes stop_codon:yes gene_type:complete